MTMGLTVKHTHSVEALWYSINSTFIHTW